MNKTIIIATFLIFSVSGFVIADENLNNYAKSNPAIQVLKIYESPTCGCCGHWAKYMSENGFKIEEIKTNDFMKIKTQYNIKEPYRSCHTAVINGYAIEGHVPYNEVKKLLSEKPKDVIGIAVAGMPQGSPGMEQGFPDDTYDVMMLMNDGTSKVVATYKGKTKIK
ncbi:CopG family transcriptional regulator [Helicobacter didelphidarum]|uniref:CopG family transcriptional regulator n=1 Tax=Helicobacter didelphidarum TaxID=2040648 RepID=A0A3D8II14_9HELI|nr:DUF411 domain-containing protein [Helicobacter didelphidarum]RDU64977.1 CopG family transcriptional regulator [Helicobacter didelphidarum]